MRNLDACYAAFDVKPGEKLYLAPRPRPNLVRFPGYSKILPEAAKSLKGTIGIVLVRQGASVQRNAQKPTREINLASR